MRKISLLLVIVLMIMSLNVFSTMAATPTSYGELLHDLGVIKGTNSGLNEGRTITRAELITIMVRLSTRENEETFKIPTTPTFKDVPTTHWAFEAVEMAYARGITSGKGNHLFGVNDNVTYQQSVTFLLRLLQHNFEYKDALAKAREVSVSLNEDRDNNYIMLRSDVFQLITKALNSNIANSNIRLLDVIPTYANGRESFYHKSALLLRSNANNVIFENFHFDYTIIEDTYTGSREGVREASQLSHYISLEIASILNLFKGSYQEVLFDDFFQAISINDQSFEFWFRFFKVFHDEDYALTGEANVTLNKDGSIEFFLDSSEGYSDFGGRVTRVYRLDNKEIPYLTPYYIEVEVSLWDDVETYHMFFLVDDDGVYKIATTSTFIEGVYMAE